MEGYWVSFTLLVPEEGNSSRYYSVHHGHSPGSAGFALSSQLSNVLCPSH